MTKNSVVADLLNYMAQWAPGSRYSDWYVGISEEPKTRLFSGHGVRENGDGWIFRECLTSFTARDIETHFIGLGTAGGPGGGDSGARFVYAYKKAAHTKEG